MRIGCQRFSCCKNDRLTVSISSELSVQFERCVHELWVVCVTHIRNSISRTKNSHIIEFDSVRSFVVCYIMSAQSALISFASLTLSTYSNSLHAIIISHVRGRTINSYFECWTLHRNNETSVLCFFWRATMKRLTRSWNKTNTYSTNIRNAEHQKMKWVPLSYLLVSNAVSRPFNAVDSWLHHVLFHSFYTVRVRGC